MLKCTNCGRTNFQNKGNLATHAKWCGVPFNEAVFWGSLVRLPWSGCWVWMGAVSDRGYGVIALREDHTKKPKPTGAHRISYTLTKGAITPGAHVLHTCDTPACCNPEHLWLGTPADNAHDKVIKGRHSHGEKNAHAKLTEDQARHIWSLKGRAAAGDLADEYGVRNGAIEAIWAGRSWKHLHRFAA